MVKIIFPFLVILVLTFIHQFDSIKHQIYEYYIDEEELPEIQEEIRKYSKSLKKAKATQEEYNTLLNKIEIIDEVIYRKL